MATASYSLFNMSVAADTTPSNQTLLMPKLDYRFRVLFINFGLDANGTALTRQVIDVTRPNVSFQKIPLQIYNSTLYVAGKHSWQNLTVNLRDDSSGSVSKLVGQQLQKQMDFVEQASAASAQDYKFQINLDMLDGGNGANEPVILERWEIYGCYLESANYGSLNYGGTDVAKIALTVVFDNAVQTPLESGVGFPVIRGTPVGQATGIG